jgi:hypothetical protein
VGGLGFGLNDLFFLQNRVHNEINCTSDTISVTILTPIPKLDSVNDCCGNNILSSQNSVTECLNNILKFVLILHLSQN